MNNYRKKYQLFNSWYKYKCRKCEWSQNNWDISGCDKCGFNG